MSIKYKNAHKKVIEKEKRREEHVFPINMHYRKKEISTLLAQL